VCPWWLLGDGVTRRRLQGNHDTGKGLRNRDGAAGEQRKSAALAMSAGSPRRFIGVRSSILASISGVITVFSWCLT